MLFEFDSIVEQKAKLKVIGVGGAGGNAVNRMIQAGMQGVDFIAVNTDAQDLENNAAKHKIQIGKNLTKGLGAGAKADVGRDAIEADREAIVGILEGADMVFITGGMGGGTGTGASASVALLARELEILTVGIVTLPFNFEGPKRMNRGMGGLSDLRKACDTVISIPNQTQKFCCLRWPNGGFLLLIASMECLPLLFGTITKKNFFWAGTGSVKNLFFTLRTRMFSPFLPN